MNNLIYHYTSLRTLYSIIENQSFWLTDLWSSMDKKEMTYAEELIHDKGVALLGQEQPFFVPAHNFYSLSCTHNADSYFHFNCYADNCMGVSIGINPNFLEYGIPSKQCLRMIGYHLYFADVIYDIDLQRKNIEEFIKTHYAAHSDLDFQKEHILSDTYNAFMARIKRPEFALEQEVRFIYRQDYGGCKTVMLPLGNGDVFSLDKFLDDVGLDHTSQHHDPQKVKYTYFGNRIRKYYDFSLKPFGINNVIKSVTIGPRARQDIYELKEYLASRQITAEVKKSEIELRD